MIENFETDLITNVRLRNLSPLRKVKNKEMPQSIQVSKAHKAMIINFLKFVILCVFLPLWLNYTFQRWLKFSILIHLGNLNKIMHWMKNDDQFIWKSKDISQLKVLNNSCVPLSVSLFYKIYHNSNVVFLFDLSIHPDELLILLFDFCTKCFGNNYNISLALTVTFRKVYLWKHFTS